MVLSIGAPRPDGLNRARRPATPGTEPYAPRTRSEKQTRFSRLQSEPLMDSHELKDLLDAVRDGRVAPGVAAERIQLRPYQDAGEFAKVDLHRRVRCGFPEVIFGQGKTAPQIEAILKTLLEHGQGGLVTRLDPQAAIHLSAVFPQGEHNALGRTFRVRGLGDAGAEGRPRGDRDGRHQRLASRRRGSRDGRGLELRRLAGGRRRRRGIAPAACISFRISRMPMRSWSSRAWKGRCRAWSADWSSAP